MFKPLTYSSPTHIVRILFFMINRTIGNAYHEFLPKSSEESPLRTQQGAPTARQNFMVSRSPWSCYRYNPCVGLHPITTVNLNRGIVVPFWCRLRIASISAIIAPRKHSCLVKKERRVASSYNRLNRNPNVCFLCLALASYKYWMAKLEKCSSQHARRRI